MKKRQKAIVRGQHRTEEDREEVLRRVAAGEVPGHVADDTGITRTTVYAWLKQARATATAGEKPLGFPDFTEAGDEEETAEEILARMERGFLRQRKAAAARKWFEIKVPQKKPYGVIWFGDPHIDDGGCNLPLLKQHIAIAQQDGVYGANIGDTTNNWPWTGRLARLWAESEVSNRSAKKLAKWFMFDSGVRWLVWLLGNHDEWNGGTEFYKEMGASFVPMLDWRAQFKLVHPSGTSVRVDAAHGRKGSSIYNPAHSTLRAAKFGESADVYVTGHTHSFNLTHFEDAERGNVSWLAQVRGYKMMDHYATVNGFAEYQHGSAVMMVVRPDNGAVQFFTDPVEGAEYLRFLRA